MLSSASTTITIYRGESVDEWGDPIDNNTVVETGIPAAITELNQDSEGEVSGAPRVIRSAIGRVGSEVEVLQNDRIFDETRRSTWIILSVTRQSNPVCAMDTKLELKQVN